MDFEIISHECSAHQIPFRKGSTLKGKNLHPRGANSFLLGYIPSHKGDRTNLTFASPENVSVPLKMYLRQNT